MTTMVRTARLLDGPPLGPRPAGVDVEAAVAAAGLVGRGGGGFPTARKLAAVRGRRRTPVLVANAAEGEPLSRKDAALLTRAPHLVLDGIVLAAQAVGARTAHLCVHSGAPQLHAALARHDLGGIEVRVVEVPARYVASEASALVQLLSGGPARPTTRLPRMAEKGVRGAPTLVLNAETLANIALSVHIGPAAYRAVGDPAEPGTLLLTVTGAVPDPRVVELPTGSPLGAALGRADVGAVLTGGFGGAWVPGHRAWDVPLTYAGVRAAGGALGPGVLAVLPRSACGLAETVAIARYLAGQSAGQCGPCVFGLPDLAGALEAAAAGGPHAPAALEAVRRWSATLPGRGACRHPDGAARLVASACGSSPPTCPRTSPVAPAAPGTRPASWPCPDERPDERRDEGRGGGRGGPDRLPWRRPVRRPAAGGGHPGRLGLPDRRPAAARQREGGQACGGSLPRPGPATGGPMSNAADRDRTLSRIRTTTAVTGIGAVLAGGALVGWLDHAATDEAGTSTSTSTDSSSDDGNDDGLTSTTAPDSGTGDSTQPGVTSGGS